MFNVKKLSQQALTVEMKVIGCGVNFSGQIFYEAQSQRTFYEKIE
jgi:hypothetical protein